MEDKLDWITNTREISVIVTGPSGPEAPACLTILCNPANGSMALNLHDEVTRGTFSPMS